MSTGLTADNQYLSLWQLKHVSHKVNQRFIGLSIDGRRPQAHPEYAVDDPRALAAMCVRRHADGEPNAGAGLFTQDGLSDR